MSLQCPKCGSNVMVSAAAADVTCINLWCDWRSSTHEMTVGDKTVKWTPAPISQAEARKIADQMLRDTYAEDQHRVCPLCGGAGDVLGKGDGKYYCRACISALAGVQQGGARLYTRVVMFCDKCGQPHFADEEERMRVAHGYTWSCARCGWSHAPIFSERMKLREMGEKK